MDSKPDNHDADLPAVGSAEDLEEALKWLEDLTARQSKSTDLSNPVPAASLDSPFRGLIDDDEGDLPDWLREAPATPAADSFAEGDAESRLDWLAKMAQRESIEELPTLEWRRLSEPVQSAMIPPGHEPPTETPDTAPAAGEMIEPAAETDAHQPPERFAESTEPVALVEEAAGELPEAPAAPADDVIAEWPTAEPPVDTADMVAAADEELRLTIEAGEELPPLDDLDAAMAWIEELAASQDAPIEEIPSVADRALASKLMMEAGLSPEGSILDELGSDSGLVEGLTPTHPFIEEEDFADTVVLVETIAAEQGMTLDEPESHPEAEAEAIPATPSLRATPGLDDFPPPTTIDEGDEAMSFEAAMAVLDEIAVAQQSETDRPAEPMTGALLVGQEEDSLSKTARDLAEAIAVEASTVAIIDATTDEAAPLAAADAPWNEETDESLVAPEPFIDSEIAGLIVVSSVHDPAEPPAEESDSEPVAEELPVEAIAWIGPATAEQANAPDEAEARQPDPVALEATLAALDALALPTGRTLQDIDARLQTAQLTPWRDVTSALDWLEGALAAQPSPTPVAVVAPDVDEAGWFERMPEDPDAVLAWLERMAAAEGNEDVAAAPAEPENVVYGTEMELAVAAAVPEIGEADLLSMPEDPDEAMAWLESLAHGGPPATRHHAPEADQVIGEGETVAEVFPDTTSAVGEDMADEVEAGPETSWTVEEEATTAAEVEPQTIPSPEIEAAAVTPEIAKPLDVAEDVAPTGDAVPNEEPPKRKRGRPRKTADPAPTVDAEPAVVDAAPPPEQSPEAPAEPPPPAAKPRKSWVDLLKPLD